QQAQPSGLTPQAPAEQPKPEARPEPNGAAVKDGFVSTSANPYRAPERLHPREAGDMPSPKYCGDMSLPNPMSLSEADRKLLFVSQRYGPEKPRVQTPNADGPLDLPNPLSLSPEERKTLFSTQRVGPERLPSETPQVRQPRALLEFEHSRLVAS